MGTDMHDFDNKDRRFTFDGHKNLMNRLRARL